jgi:hypothetical protein
MLVRRAAVTPALFALIAMLMVPTRAPAMELKIVGNQLILSGPVVGDEPGKVREALASSPSIDTVILRNSGGGNAPAGYQVGQLLRERGLRTAVPGYCYSSCSRMFLGGSTRYFTDDYMPEYNNVGFHGHYDRMGASMRISVEFTWSGKKTVYRVTAPAPSWCTATAKFGAVRRRHGLRPRRSGPRRFDARRRAVRKLRGRTDPSRAFGGIKGATTRLTAPAYWKFESSPLQRRVARTPVQTSSMVLTKRSRMARASGPPSSASASSYPGRILSASRSAPAQNCAARPGRWPLSRGFLCCPEARVWRLACFAFAMRKHRCFAMSLAGFPR